MGSLRTQRPTPKRNTTGITQKDKTVLERDVQGKTIGHARGRGVICRKLNFGEGWPDYMLLTDGEILFMEFKRSSGGRLKPLQVFVHDMLRKAGFVVHVINSVAEGTLIIEEWIEDVRPMLPNGSTVVVDYMQVTKALVRSKK